MSRLAAEQLIYMRVEAPYSPNRRTGYQTVWRSAAIAAEAAQAIERRVQCFQPDSADRQRVQYFTLAGGLIVVARTATIDSDPEIVDRDRRPGAFCVQCRILRPMDFAKLDYDPFHVLDAARFEDNPRRMVAAWGQATGVAPPCELEASPPPPLAAVWQGNQALRLTALGWSAEAARRDRCAVVISGAGGEIEDALRVVFALLPRSRRPACSFNTFGERCPAAPGDYWCVGAAAARRMCDALTAAGGRGAVEVNAAAGTVGEAPAVRERTLYLDWLAASLRDKEPAALLREAATVEAIAAALSGEGGAVPPGWEPRAVGELFESCHEALLAHLAATAQPLLGEALAQYLGGYLLRRGPELDAGLVLASLSAQRDVAVAALARLAVIYLKELHPGVPPADSDLRHLSKLAGTTRNWVLLHWTSTFGGARDERARDEALRCMSSEEFKVALTLLGRPIAAADFVGSRHLRALLHDERIAALGDAQVVELVEVVLRGGHGDELAALAPLIPRLGPTALSQLRRATHGRRGAGMAEELRRALDSCPPDARPKRGFLGRMR